MTEINKLPTGYQALTSNQSTDDKVVATALNAILAKVNELVVAQNELRSDFDAFIDVHRRNG